MLSSDAIGCLQQGQRDVEAGVLRKSIKVVGLLERRKNLKLRKVPRHLFRFWLP
jgi:hypothetical protein